MVVKVLYINLFYALLPAFSCRGYLVAFKLSPNLRKPHKDAKGADENRKREIELCKMERIIALSRG